MINVMCAADIHLGKQVGQSGQTSSPVIAAWERLIDACLDLDIHLLILAGDLIDRNGLFIEMHGLLRKGILRLVEKGIRVVAVAGNHDAETLVAFNHALGVSALSVVGAEGKWERISLEIKGRVVHIDGISFVSGQMRNNPLVSQVWKKEEILLGVLHADVDSPKSPYAPVKSSDFYGLPHQAWILGHVHIPKQIHAEKPWVHYCGSLQGLDITETGSHGAWKLTIDLDGHVTAEHIPLAPLQWEQITLDLTGMSREDWEEKLLNQIESAMAKRALFHIEQMGVRLRFEGATEVYPLLRRQVSRLNEQVEPSFFAHGRWIPYFIESIQNETRPLLDLETLAKGSHIAAALARHLLDPHVDLPALREHLQTRWRSDSYLKQCPYELIDLEDAELLAIYQRQGYALLDELLK